jgi:hypothetical protein
MRADYWDNNAQVGEDPDKPTPLKCWKDEPENRLVMHLNQQSTIHSIWGY